MESAAVRGRDHGQHLALGVGAGNGVQFGADMGGHPDDVFHQPRHILEYGMVDALQDVIGAIVFPGLRPGKYRGYGPNRKGRALAKVPFMEKLAATSGKSKSGRVVAMFFSDIFAAIIKHFPCFAKASSTSALALLLVAYAY